MMPVLAFVHPTNQRAAQQLRLAANHARTAARIVEQVMTSSRQAADVVNDIMPDRLEETAAYALIACAETLESEQ